MFTVVVAGLLPSSPPKRYLLNCIGGGFLFSPVRLSVTENTSRRTISKLKDKIVICVNTFSD